MSKSANIAELKRLSIDEQLRIIDALCEEIESQELKLSPALLAEMNRRLEAGRSDRASNLTLDQLRALNEQLSK